MNLQDDRPKIYFGPHSIERDDDVIPPFYISLNVLDTLFHNCLLDSRDSHNLMPKKVMDELGLEVTKSYHDLYSFDSKKVRCFDVVKDLAVSLTQLAMKSMVMDVVVDDIPPRFRMLLSRSWSKKLGGSLQLYMSYAIVPVFGGEYRRLYRETQLAYIVGDHDNPTNHPFYIVEQDLGLSILHTTTNETRCLTILKPSYIKQEKGKLEPENQIWKMCFDGYSSREGLGDVVLFFSPTNHVISLSYNMEFETTNNTAKYKALILGLKATKDIKVEHTIVFGDSKLIIQQVKNAYQVKHPKLKTYRNEVWIIIESYFAPFNISFIPRDSN